VSDTRDVIRQRCIAPPPLHVLLATFHTSRLAELCRPLGLDRMMTISRRRGAVIFWCILHCLLCSFPTCVRGGVYVPTPPPVIDDSGARSNSAYLALSTTWSAQASWNPNPTVFFRGSTAALTGSDLKPLILLTLTPAPYAGAKNVRFENTIPLPVALRYTKPRSIGGGTGEIVLPPHGLSDMMFLPPDYSSLWTNLVCVAMDPVHGNRTLWSQPAMPWTVPSIPPGMKDYHNDFIMIQLQLTTYAMIYRSLQYQLVIADRRQHPTGTALSSIVPASDIQFIDCIGRGQMGYDYACFLPLTFDPDMVDPNAAATAEPMSVTPLLWQYYIYEVRRLDTWQGIANGSILPAQVEYQPLPHGTPFIEDITLATRTPVQFLPVAGVFAYVPSPFEAKHMQPGDAQLSSDVCNPDVMSCFTMYAHSGIRVNGLFATAAGDIHLCRFNDFHDNNAFYILGSVSSSGTSLECILTLDAFESCTGGAEISLAAIHFFPADRGYHSRAQEQTWEAMNERDVQDRAERADGDLDRLIEERRMAALGRTRRSGVFASMVGVLDGLVSTESIERTSEAGHEATTTLSDAQLAHPHAEHIQQLLAGSAAVAEPATATPSDASSSPRDRHPLSSSTTVTADPYAWSPSDFTLPYDGIQVLSDSLTRLFVSHQAVAANPADVRARRDTFVYALTSSVALSTFILVVISVTLMALCALCDRYGDKCPRLSRIGSSSHRSPADFEMADRFGVDDHLVAVRLVDVEPAPAPLAQSMAESHQRDGSVAPAAPPEDDGWVWSFDFKMEERIDQQMKHVRKHVQAYAATSSTSSSAIAAATPHASANSKSKRNLKSAHAPANRHLAAPLLDHASEESKEDIEAHGYQPPRSISSANSLTSAAAPNRMDDESMSHYSAM
jgi:hypothetical protein